MKKIVLFFTMVCLGTTMCIADNDGYNSCIIETASGDTIECLAKLNFFTLSYKINPNDKAQKLKPSEVRFATFCENDTCFIWSGLPIVMPDKALKGKTKGMSRGFHQFLVNPKEGKLAISTMIVSDAEPSSTLSAPALDILYPTIPINTATVREITTHTLATLLDNFNLFSSSIAINLNKI